MWRYQISGLDVASEFALAGAIERDASRAAAADVDIRRGSVPETLEGTTASGPNWQLAGRTFLLSVPRVARFLIDNGRSITVASAPEATANDVAVFILGSALGILLHQRGLMVLHGATVARNGRAVAICGRSGAGKSTFAASLCENGCRFVSDDISVVSLGPDGLPVVLPDGRRLKLWQQAIDRLRLGERRGTAVREAVEKYYIDPGDCVEEAVPLAAIYILGDVRGREQPGMTPLALPDAMRMLDIQSYRPRVRARIGDKSSQLTQSAAVLGKVRVFRFNRHLGFEHMQSAVDEFVAHWDGPPS